MYSQLPLRFFRSRSKPPPKIATKRSSSTRFVGSLQADVQTFTRPRAALDHVSPLSGNRGPTVRAASRSVVSVISQRTVGQSRLQIASPVLFRHLGALEVLALWSPGLSTPLTNSSGCVMSR